MRKRGLVAELAVYQQVEEETSIGIENLLEMLEDNLTLNRQKAAVGLGKLEEIDEEAIKALQRVAALDPNVHVREAAQKALQAPVHQNYLANKLAKTPPDQSESTLPSTDPQTDYEQAVAFLNARDRDKAVEKFALAFRMGGRNLRAQALAQLETLDEVEVF